MRIRESPFTSYKVIYRLDMTVEAVLPLRIGIGRGEGRITEPDLAVFKDQGGTPVIPGSSLKGFFRANTHRLLANFLGESEANMVLEEVFGSSDNHASCLFFGDLWAKDARCVERKHIRINPETGAVANLFEVELVQEGALFTGRGVTARNLAPSLLGLFHTVKTLADHQIARLGGFKSRGYGAVKIAFPALSIILPGTTIQDVKAGITVEELVGAERATVTFNDGQAQVDEDELKTAFNAQLQSEPAYFGTEIKVERPEQLLEKLAENLTAKLRTGAEGGGVG